MTEKPELALAAFEGILLGGAFFGGLWWTVRHGIRSAAPGLWFLGSLLIRSATAVSVLYLVSQADWRRLAACLAGFLLARIAVVRLSGTPAAAAGTPPIKAPT